MAGPQAKQREVYMQESITTSRLATTEEAAFYLGVSKSFLDNDRCQRRHGIPFHRIGRAIRYDLRELDQWLIQNRALDPAQA